MPSSGRWALGLQKLPLLRFHSCAWVVRTNVPGSVSAVGAGVLTRPPRNVLIGALGRSHGAARPQPSPLRGEGGPKGRMRERLSEGDETKMRTLISQPYG